MTRRVLRGLRRDATGATTIEFAVTALALVTILIGVVEAGLFYWSWQALEGAAIDAARCAAVNKQSCPTPATTPLSTQNYAASAALARGLTGVTFHNVTVTTGTAAQTACGTTANVVSVALSYNFGLSALVPFPSSVSASACFPVIS